MHGARLEVGALPRCSARNRTMSPRRPITPRDRGRSGRLAPGTPVDRLSPGTLARAIVEGQQQSPSVLAAMYGLDIAELTVKISEGALYPNSR